jgi:imidazolonepropionase-like amidohydrolase
VEPEWQGPDSCRAFVREQAAMGFDAVKFLLSNDDVFIPGGSQITQYTQEEASAAGEQARESGVWLNCHAQSAESVKVAVRAGFRSVYHCTYADSEALDLLESVKDEVFVSPAPGIIYANVYEGEEFGIDRAQAEKMGSVAALEGMAAVYPEIRKRGIRALPGGDYGFPNNPIGRNGRDLDCSPACWAIRRSRR